jgi:hypothetical protein
MKSFFQKPKAALLIGSACFCLFFLQGCITDRVIGPTPEAPIVLNFELQTPVIVSEAESEKYEKALCEHTVLSATRIKVDGHVIWPPLSGINTDRVSTSGRKAGVTFVSRPTKTQQVLRRSAFSRVSKPNSTQFIGFKSQAEMRAFLKAISQ